MPFLGKVRKEYRVMALVEPGTSFQDLAFAYDDGHEDGHEIPYGRRKIGGSEIREVQRVENSFLTSRSEVEYVTGERISSPRVHYSTK